MPAVAGPTSAAPLGRPFCCADASLGARNSGVTDVPPTYKTLVEDIANL